MINFINVPEKLYNLLSDDLQYNLKLVSNYFNIDSNQIMYDIDEIFDLCVKGIQASSKIGINIQDFQSILNFNKSNSLIDIFCLRQGCSIDAKYNIIRQTNCFLSKEHPYTFLCKLTDTQPFQYRSTTKFLVR